MSRPASCSWCGEPLDYDEQGSNALYSCGATDCEKACARMEREEREDAQARAAEDDFERYR